MSCKGVLRGAWCALSSRVTRPIHAGSAGWIPWASCTRYVLLISYYMCGYCDGAVVISWFLFFVNRVVVPPQCNGLGLLGRHYVSV